MKKCVVVSDSFKGSLSSVEIGEIAKEVIPAVFPGCEVAALPVADGGEGTVECFIRTAGFQPVAVRVSGPFGEMVDAVYARRGETAVLEMAAAAGLPLVKGQPDPSRATSFGVGQMLRHAVESGSRRIIMGLGGSATNDGGCGCAAALGAVFRRSDGQEFCPVGASLSEIESIDFMPVKTLLSGVDISVMCDVTNPLYGPEGAAYVFAPQKGADAATTAMLDKQLRAFGSTLLRETGVDAAQIPGAGAAGGMGAGCAALLGAALKPGIEAILDAVDLDGQLEGADLVITGEGRLDSQSLRGKVISGVTRRAALRGIPVVAIVGGVDDSAYAAYELGVGAIFSINRLAVPFREAAPRSAENYRRTLEDVMRLIRLFT